MIGKNKSIETKENSNLKNKAQEINTNKELIIDIITQAQEELIIYLYKGRGVTLSKL